MRICVGERAKDYTNCIYDAKRMVGKRHDDETVQAYLNKWTFKCVPCQSKNCEIDIPNIEPKLKIEEVSGHVLRYMSSIAE